MPQDLLARAHEQAKRSEAPVRAAALLRIARVQTAFNREQARQTFQEALAETHRLSGQDCDFLFDQARFLAAAVAPDLLPGIPPGDRGLRQFSSEMLGKIMLDHGHADAAYEFLMRYDEPSGFPFDLVLALMQRIDEEVRRLAMLRRAIEAWRAAPDSRTAHRFISLVQFSWQVLPPEEARELAREIVRLTLSQPDHPTSATYDMEQKVRITSGRQHTLFLILHILRRLDASLAESLIAEHQQLAAAALRFPNGIESVQEEAEHRRRTAVGTTGSGGFGMAGSPRDFPYMRALMQGSQDGDLGPAMEHALAKYQEDTGPRPPKPGPARVLAFRLPLPQHSLQGR
jgi:hypothetical protein